jgi:hypothetical protein
MPRPAQSAAVAVDVAVAEPADDGGLDPELQTLPQPSYAFRDLLPRRLLTTLRDSAMPYDRALVHLAQALDHGDAIRHHLVVYREASAAPAPRAAEHELNQLERRNAAMERELADARRRAHDAGSAGLLSMIDDAFAERSRLQRAIRAAVAL